MNYKKIYNNLIFVANTRNNNLQNYEIHHIKPKCCGGSDDDSNLVKLTYREHYLAHKLLVKIYSKNKQLAIALWLMTLTTITSIAKLQNNSTNIRQTKRIKSILESRKNKITTHEYNFSKTEYIKHMIGHDVTDQTKKLISENTKNGMLSEEVIKKCSSGSKGTRHYYNKKTLKCYKWFPGDPEIDLNVYNYGRPPMSKKQKKKISNIKTLNKTKYHNDKLQLTIDIYHNCICKVPNNWFPKKKEYKNNVIFRNLIHDVKVNLLKYNIFFNNILTYTPKEITQKKKILNPAFFDILYDKLLNWKTNTNIVDDIVFFIKDNLELVKEKANEYLTEEFKK